MAFDSGYQTVPSTSLSVSFSLCLCLSFCLSVCLSLSQSFCVECCCVWHQGQICKKSRLVLKSLSLCNKVVSSLSLSLSLSHTHTHTRTPSLPLSLPPNPTQPPVSHFSLSPACSDMQYKKCTDTMCVRVA